MQISAQEVTKLLTTDEALKSKRGKSRVEFKNIELEALPKTKVAEPDKAEVARVMEMVNQAPDVREDVVMQLKERIEKGEYKVKGEEIADMMLRRMKADKVR
jgi:anti-sigma28 factor (negative regulator of flagellin synthesis)